MTVRKSIAHWARLAGHVARSSAPWLCCFLCLASDERPRSRAGDWAPLSGPLAPCPAPKLERPPAARGDVIRAAWPNTGEARPGADRVSRLPLTQTDRPFLTTKPRVRIASVRPLPELQTTPPEAPVRDRRPNDLAKRQPVQTDEPESGPDLGGALNGQGTDHESPIMATDIAPPSAWPGDEHEIDLDASRPFAHQAAPRTPEMEAVSRQAAAHLNRGHELAARGAVYSARSEFTKALRMIAQALDLAAAGDRHGAALSAGLRALDEAEDFVPHGKALETDLNLKVLIESHRTPILKDADLDALPAIKAQQQYYTYAQEQLGVAAGSEPVGSMALFGLGKLYATFAEQPYTKVVAPLPKAMVYYQAALWTSPGNYMAANELAVLMAGQSRYEGARELLRHSVRVSPHPTTWRNLAAVHRQLGEADLARLADLEVARMAHSPAGGAQAVAGRASPGRATQPVEWVAPESFARQSTPVNAARLPSAKDRPNAIVPAWKRATLEPGRRG